MRLSQAERKRIAHAAQARDLRFSSFVRWAALEAASDQLERAKPQPKAEPAVPEREPVVLAPEPPRRHWVDGELVDAQGRLVTAPGR